MKYFLDCGFYVGKALDYYAPLMDESWIVYAFEPNTELNVEESIKRFPFQVNWVSRLRTTSPRGSWTWWLKQGQRCYTRPA